MSAQPIGYVDELVERRESLVANLSPAAKHAAFPKLYAKPVPLPTDEAMFRSSIATLEREKASLIRVNAQLRDTIANLRGQIESLAASAGDRIPQRRNAPRAVIDAFLNALNAIRAGQGAKPSSFDDLVSPRRSRYYTAPRHVCMWLVRQLCTHYSLPMIGKVFGNRDHTTAMHACARAPFWVLVDPALKTAADAVLAKFDAPETKGEQA